MFYHINLNEGQFEVIRRGVVVGP